MVRPTFSTYSQHFVDRFIATFAEQGGRLLLELSKGVEVVSIITKESAENLKLAEGKDAYAVIKASSVMIAID